jgi:4-hydroxythreonine-4-phosphate dehydrogenase
MPLPRIGLTIGDPSGIGPEIAEKAASDSRVLAVCEPVLYGPSGSERRGYHPGVGVVEGGRVSFEAVKAATLDAMEGRLDAISTAPINKGVWAAAGLSWRGHTDLLASLTGAPHVAMMFYTERLRVVLATVHVPIAEVPTLLTRERLRRTIELAATELPRFGIATPRLALAGLNPHAGEDGLIGEEEATVLAPAVASCRSSGIDVCGPLPGDTVFVRALNGEFDAVVACYHDQGLIPIKILAFGQAVNVTLGLPIIRTSVDHGTAYDIAGTNTADPSSMVEAVCLAARLASAPVSHD